MKKQLLFFLITILSLNCYSQISFEKGYYIDNSNQKVDCLIKNSDWQYNPDQFEYKLSENAGQQLLNIRSVKEFGIYNVSKYTRFTVNIDRSKEILSEMSAVSDPVFAEEELFLKVLVEGKASLYLFKSANLTRFFYNKDNSAPVQLIFKSYTTSENKIGKNNSFRQQLLNDLKCQNTTMNGVTNISYDKNELVNFFVEYNKCNSAEFINFEARAKRDLFNLTLRPGLNSSSMKIDNIVTDGRDADFGSKLALRLGIEAEFIMPFNKNKWAILVEPTYQSFKSEKQLPAQNVKADYKSIELPIGLRHYFFLKNSNSKIYLNGLGIFDFRFNSKIYFESTSDFNINTRNNLAVGLGYKQNDKYSVELRGYTNRPPLGEYHSWSSDYHTLSVIFGYRIF